MTLLGPPQQFRDQQYNRSVSQAELRKLNHKQHFIVSMHLKGLKASEIAEMMGCNTNYVYKTLKLPEAVAIRQQLMAGVADELEAMFPKVVQTIEAKLESEDERVQLSAVDAWSKLYDKCKGGASEKLTAEDVVKSLLTQNIQINVQIDNAGTGALAGDEVPTLELRDE